MPQYEYQCTRCGNIVTKQFNIKDKPLIVPCPCGGRAKSIMSAPNIRINENIDPMTNRFSRMDTIKEMETSEDREIEDSIPNVDSDDLYD